MCNQPANTKASKSKHTTGPWEVVKDGVTHIIKQKDGPLIAATYGFAALDRKEERAAHARLIAAAPDLFSVLEELVADNRILSMNIRNVAVLERAKAALALARPLKWTQEAFSAFLDGFSKAAGLSREDGEDQWAGYGCLLSKERRELLEAGALNPDSQRAPLFSSANKGNLQPLLPCPSLNSKKSIRPRIRNSFRCPIGTRRFPISTPKLPHRGPME